MKRFLCNTFRIFRLKQQNFGERIAAGSVEFFDNTFDDNYTVTDDSQGNLHAWPNLFSKVQEVRHIENDIRDGTAGYDCPLPLTGSPEAPTLLTGSLTSSLSASTFLLPVLTSLSWSYGTTNEDGFNLYKSMTSDGTTWTPFTSLLSTPANVTWSPDQTTASIAGLAYYVTAYNMFGESAASNTVTFGPLTASSVSASAIFWSASYVTWSMAPEAHGYYLFRSADSGSSWTNVATTSIAVTSSYDYGLAQTSSYSYRVVVFNPVLQRPSLTSSISTPAAP
jgi:hypothetical protein